MSPFRASSRPAFRAEIGLAALLFAATLALFGPARGYEFLSLDDTFYIVDNPMVAEGWSWAGAKQAFTTVYEQWWLPLLWLSYMADIEVFGPGPHGHHLTNILLHAANAALLFWALFRMTGSRWRSAFAAALFAWHPLRVESVAWITERKDVLSGLFFLLAVLAYVRQASGRRAYGLWPVFGLMLLGSMAKSILIVLPCLLLLLDYWPLGRVGDGGERWAWFRWRPLLVEKIPLIVLSGVFTYLTLVTHGVSGGEPTTASWFERLALVAPNYGIYLAKTGWPAGLTILNPTDLPTPLSVCLLAPLGLAVLTLLAWRFRKSQPYLLVGWLWFLIALFPVVRGIRFDEQSAFSDRYTYLPSIGLGLILAWGAGAVQERRRRLRVPVVAACGLVLAACLARTHVQLPWWRDSLTMFRRAVDLATGHPLSHGQYGLALIESGRTQEGEAHLREALRLDPDNGDYLSIWGMALLRLDRAEEALAAHDRAIALHPRVARFHNNRGNALAKLGRQDEARTAFEEALRLRPGSAQAHYNLGNLLVHSGRVSEALLHYEAATRGRPDLAATWFKLGVAYAQLGRLADATACLERALQIDPDLPGGKAALSRLRRQAF